jgi:fructokinase
VEIMFDIVAVGELLIDFAPVRNEYGTFFKENPGGALCNMLTMAQKLGSKTAFIGKVGNDQFGIKLGNVLKAQGIETAGLIYSEDYNTTLAFVHLDEKGDRSFSFYRNPGADMTLSMEDLDYNLIDEAKIFHFGSLSMTDEPSRSATKAALEYAKKSGKIITYDPNWRPALWKSDQAAKEGMRFGLQYADILKVSEEELVFLTGTKDISEGSRLLTCTGAKLVVVTLGPKGCFYHSAAGSGYLNTYDTKIVDTTGAGDAFFGALIYQISRYAGKIDEIKVEEIRAMIDFSNAAGALCSSQKGAINVMPSFEEVRYCMENVPLLIV